MYNQIDPVSRKGGAGLKETILAFLKNLRLHLKQESAILNIYRREVNERNYQSLRAMTAFSSLLCLVSFFNALFTPFFYPSMPIYFAGLMVSLGLALLLETVVARRRSLTPVLLYVTLFFFHALGIVMGIFRKTDTPATIFFVLLVALPIFVIERPLRLCLVSTISCASFCLADLCCKADGVLQQDLGNALACWLTSCFCILFLMRIKTGDLAHTGEVTAQRDTDELTRISSRRAAEGRISQALDYGAPGSLCALYIIDVDHFKDVNDTLGHQTGDEVLRQVGEKLQGVFRRGDVVGRLGGDEFVVFLSRLPDEELPLKKAGDIVRRLRFQVPGGSRPLFISVSVGLALGKTGEFRYEELYRRADSALYRSKESGRDRFSLWREKSGI